MYGVFVGQVGKVPCALLGLKSIWLDIRGFLKKHIQIRGLVGL